MSAGNLSRFEQKFISELALLNAPIEYVTDSRGRKVRVPNKARPVTYEEVREMCMHMRALDEEEILEAVGPSTFAFMKSSGQIKKDTLSKARYWITKKCADYYDLPEYLGPRTFVA